MTHPITSNMADGQREMLSNENSSLLISNLSSTIPNFSTNNVASSFTDSVIILPDAPVQSFAQRRLSTLFESEMSKIESYTDEHWKTPEFPLARIKKIMRIDEDVKMISGEVPVLLSKVIELFVTELTLRSWLLTEDGKRRTVQRSDIAMAIAKNDIFDFLIDIVPREEINSRNRSESSATQSSGLSPELVQLYLQLLAQQNDTQTSTVGGEGTGRKQPSSSVQKELEETSQSAIEQTVATNTILQQQINLIQQIAHLQQQISKTVVCSNSEQPPLPPPSPSSLTYTNSSMIDDSQMNFRSIPTCSITSTSNNSPVITGNIQDMGTPSANVSSSDLLLPSSLAPVTPFLTELTASQYNTSPTTFSSVSDLSTPTVQRYVINPGGGFTAEHGLHSISSSSQNGNRQNELIHLNNVSSGRFSGTDISLNDDGRLRQ